MLISKYLTNLTALALMIMLYITNKEHLGKEKRVKYLSYMIFVTMVASIAETVSYILEGQSGLAVTIALYIANSLTFISVILIGYYWQKLECDCIGASTSKFVQYGLSCIGAVGIIALIVNIFTPIVFSLENNIYERRGLYWIYIFIGGINVLNGLVVYFNAKRRGKLLVPFAVGIFVIPLIIGMVIQSLFYGVSTIWVGIAIAITGVASSIKNSLIYIDVLTRVYSRQYFDKISRELESKNDIKISGILIDINDFKYINDTLGHDIGDEALVAAANIFSESVTGLGNAIRLGGDEFLLLVNSEDENVLADVEKNINKKCKEFTENNQHGYKLSVSMGKGVFDSSKQSFEEFNALLDEAMYIQKQEYHRLNDSNDAVNVKLGAISLSSDILDKGSIGLWAFEIDEGKAPRMYVDTQMLHLIGLTKHLSPEDTYHAWYDHIDQASYELVAEAVEKMTAGEHAEAQYPWHHPDGHTLIVRCGGVRNYEYKQGIRIEGIHQDVTETIHFDEESRKRNLQELSLKIISSLPDSDSTLFYINSETGTYQIISNDRVYDDKIDSKLHKLENFFEASKENISKIIYEEDWPVANVLCDKNKMEAAFGKDNTFSIKYRVLLDGVMAWYKVKAVKIVEKDGTLYYALGFKDITEEVNLQEKALEEKTLANQKLEAALNAAEFANKAKTDFIFNMSHDIRTPMNAILWFTNMAQNHIDDNEKLINYLDKVHQSGRLLSSLIDSVLDVSRIEAGEAGLVQNKVDQNLAFATIDEPMQELAAQKGIDLSFEIGEIKDRYVYCDVNRCNRVLVNLISNAIKYTHEGGFVRVKLEQIGSAFNGYGNYRFTVEDNGIGMSKEFQKHAFEKFSREYSTTDSGIEGSGLGLSVCKSFVDLMGGTIEIQSDLGEGSIFTVNLPFKIQEGEEYLDPITGKEKNAKEEYIVYTPMNFKGKKVLLVEDNELNLEIAQEILKGPGFVVETAVNGSLAVDLVKEKGVDYYDFILMDIQMPVLDGYEATKIIRSMKNGYQVPIIAVSANAFAEDRIKSIEAGMNDHVAKPIDLNKLLNIMRTFMKKETD